MLCSCTRPANRRARATSRLCRSIRYIRLPGAVIGVRQRGAGVAADAEGAPSHEMTRRDRAIGNQHRQLLGCFGTSVLYALENGRCGPCACCRPLLWKRDCCGGRREADGQRSIRGPPCARKRKHGGVHRWAGQICKGACKSVRSIGAGVFGPGDDDDQTNLRALPPSTIMKLRAR